MDLRRDRVVDGKRNRHPQHDRCEADEVHAAGKAVHVLMPLHAVGSPQVNLLPAHKEEIRKEDCRERGVDAGGYREEAPEVFDYLAPDAEEDAVEGKDRDVRVVADPAEGTAEHDPVNVGADRLRTDVRKGDEQEGAQGERGSRERCEHGRGVIYHFTAHVLHRNRHDRTDDDKEGTGKALSQYPGPIAAPLAFGDARDFRHAADERDDECEVRFDRHDVGNDADLALGAERPEVHDVLKGDGREANDDDDRAHREEEGDQNARRPGDCRKAPVGDEGTACHAEDGEQRVEGGRQVQAREAEQVDHGRDEQVAADRIPGVVYDDYRDGHDQDADRAERRPQPDPDVYAEPDREDDRQLIDDEHEDCAEERPDQKLLKADERRKVGTLRVAPGRDAVAGQDKEGVKESVELFLRHDGKHAEHRLAFDGGVCICDARGVSVCGARGGSCVCSTRLGAAGSSIPCRSILFFSIFFRAAHSVPPMTISTRHAAATKATQR